MTFKFKFPDDVPGWLTEEEGAFLYQLSQWSLDALEIGAYCGKSTICMAQAVQTDVRTIDTFDGRATPSPANTYLSLLANLARYDVLENVYTYIGTSARIIPIIRKTLTFSLVFVDAAHDYLSVLTNAEEAWSVLRTNGLVAFHDYESPQDPEVTQAINYLISVNGWTLKEKRGTIAVLKPPHYYGEEEKA